VNRGLILAFLVTLATLAALSLVSDDAEATTNCHATGNWCKGWAQVSTTTGGVSSTRCFSFTTVNSAPACPTTTSDNAVWEMDSGACVTLYYFDTTTGAAPPAAPNKVTLTAHVDALGTTVITWLNGGAEPANGASYTFCATSNGLVGGAERAGTYQVRVWPVKDNGAALNYDIRSDGTAAVGTITTFDKGAVRGNAKIASIARNAYPAGSTFAYGTAADETITITTTLTAANGDANVETARNGITSDTTGFTTGQAGPTTDVDATTFAQSFVADNTFGAASGAWNPFFTIIGNAALTGERWTAMASTGHGAGITTLTVSGNPVAYDSTTFNIDARVVFDQDGVGGFAGADDMVVAKLGSSSGPVTSLFNKGETYYAEWYLYNARSEYVTRLMTFAREDAVPTTCTSGTASAVGNKYSATSTLGTGVTCLAANDATGSTRFVRVTNTDQNHLSGVFIRVSSFYYVDCHIQPGTPLVKDVFFTQDSAETFTYTAGANVIDGWVHAVGVRNDLEVDTSGSAIAWAFKKPDTTTIQSGTDDTGSDGWTPNAAPHEQTAQAPVGVWSFQCSVSFNGNTGSDSEAFNVISSFTGDLETQLSFPNPSIVNNAVNIYARTTRLGACFVPDAAPNITITHIDQTTTPHSSVTDVNAQSMVNVVDGTATVSSCLYRYTITPTFVGQHNILVRAKYSGAEVVVSEQWSVVREAPHLRVLVAASLEPGTAATAWLRIELTDAAQSPDSVPQARHGHVTTAYAWLEDAAYSNTKNPVTWAAAVNGALYAYNFTTPGLAGVYDLEFKVPVYGTTVRASEPFTVTETTGDILSMSALPGFTEEATTAIILFLLLLIWAVYQKWLGVAFGSLIALLSATVGSLASWADMEDWFALGLILVVFGVLVEIFVDYEQWGWVEKATNRRKAKQ
jgi:hypothetical protein